MAVLESYSAGTPDGEVVVSINWNPTSHVINNLTLSNQTGLEEGQRRLNAQITILLDGEIIADYSGNDSYVFKDIPGTLLAEEFIEDGQTYYQVPANFAYNFRVLDPLV